MHKKSSESCLVVLSKEAINCRFGLNMMIDSDSFCVAFDGTPALNVASVAVGTSSKIFNSWPLGGPNPMILSLFVS